MRKPGLTGWVSGTVDGVDEHHDDDPMRTFYEFVQLRPPGVTGPFGLGLDEGEDTIGARVI